MEQSSIRQKSSELIKQCADKGNSNCINSIDGFIAFCEKNIESFMSSGKYGLAIECERQCNYWHYQKSLVTGRNEYQMSIFSLH